MSSVLSAAAGFLIVFEGVQIEAFQVHFVTVLVVTEVVKWIDGKVTEGESCLGSADMSSFGDLGAGFHFIREMKVLPFSVRVILQLAVVTFLPALPLILLVVPIETILDVVTKTVF
jgi:hypothetical protein